MRHVSWVIAASLALAAPSIANAQVAGSTLRGVAAAELREVATGWSAKRQVLGRAVFNDNEEKIGTVDDIIVSPTKSVSYAIVGVGGFLGVAKRTSPSPSTSSATGAESVFSLARRRRRSNRCRLSNTQTNSGRWV
jgi:hypothetical protein